MLADLDKKRTKPLDNSEQRSVNREKRKESISSIFLCTQESETKRKTALKDNEIKAVKVKEFCKYVGI